MRQEPGDNMESTAQKSCWSVTFKALAGFAGIVFYLLLLVLLKLVDREDLARFGKLIFAKKS